jgi:hypothetical protein
MGGEGRRGGGSRLGREEVQDDVCIESGSRETDFEEEGILARDDQADDCRGRHPRGH